MAEVPEPVRFAFVWKWWAIVLGVFLDLAIELLLQQLGIQPLELRGMLIGMARGALIGLMAPNIGAAVGTLLANREIKALQEEA